MSMTDRQLRGFLPEDLEKELKFAQTKYYDKASNARSLKESLYYWAAVFGGPKGKRKVVREMMGMKDYKRHYVNAETAENILYSYNKADLQEAEFHNKRLGDDTKYIIVQNEKVQLVDIPAEDKISFISLVTDILEICKYPEKRLFAFILVENELDFLLELFEKKEFLGEFFEIINELYSQINEYRSNGEKRPLIKIGKKNFVVKRKDGTMGNKKFYNVTLNSFKEKVRSVLFLDKEDNNETS